MKKDLISRLDAGPVIFAEGYLFAMERRGYLSAGPFVPEVVLEHPDVVTECMKLVKDIAEAREIKETVNSLIEQSNKSE